MHDDQPLGTPEARGLQYLHVSHCTFAVSDGDAMILIDPFFSGAFTWNNHIERHLQPPAIALERFRRCDAILVSHEHGDHYDPSALATLLRQTRASIHAPLPVVDMAVRDGLPAERLVAVEQGQRFDVGALHVTVYASAGSEQRTPVDRVGFKIERDGVSFFHQGDSHGPAATWPKPGELDALVMWPHRVNEVVILVGPRRIIFQHLDRFEPGDFFCNRDPQLELEYHHHYHPDTDIVVPLRGVWCAVRDA